MSNNNPPRLLPNGMPNIEGNPLILAAFIDLLGCNLTGTMKEIMERESMSDCDPSDFQDATITAGQLRILYDILKLLGQMRASVGQNQPWYTANVMMEVEGLRREVAAHNAKMRENPIEMIAKMLGIPQDAIPQDLRDALTPPAKTAEPSKLPPVEDAADRILNDLRADGVIG